LRKGNEEQESSARLLTRRNYVAKRKTLNGGKPRRCWGVLEKKLGHYRAHSGEEKPGLREGLWLVDTNILVLGNFCLKKKKKEKAPFTSVKEGHVF